VSLLTSLETKINSAIQSDVIVPEDISQLLCEVIKKSFGVSLVKRDFEYQPQGIKNGTIFICMITRSKIAQISPVLVIDLDHHSNLEKAKIGFGF